MVEEAAIERRQENHERHELTEAPGEHDVPARGLAALKAEVVSQEGGRVNHHLIPGGLASMGSGHKARNELSAQCAGVETDISPLDLVEEFQLVDSAVHQPEADVIANEQRALNLDMYSTISWACARVANC